MDSATRRQQGGQWASVGGWDDDDLFDSPASTAPSHPQKLQPQAAFMASNHSNGHNSFDNGWGDDDSDFFPTSAPQAHQATHHASNGNHRAPNVTSQAPSAAGHHQVHIKPSTGGNLFAPTSSGSPAPSAPQSATRVAPPSSKTTVAPTKPASSFDDAGWDEEIDFSSPAPQPSTVPPKRTAATSTPSHSVSKPATSSNGNHAPSQAPAAQPQATPKSAESVRPQTRPVPASTAANGSHSAQSTPKAQVQPNSTATTQQSAAPSAQPAPLSANTQTPMKQPTALQHQGTPTVAASKPVAGDVKTPIGVIRSHKPSSSIKLPSMPTRTPQAKTAASVVPQPQTAPATPASAANTVSATPQATAAVPKVPGSSRRLTEDGKPVPLTRTSKPVIPDSPVAVPQHAAPTSVAAPIAQQPAKSSVEAVAAPKKVAAAPSKIASPKPSPAAVTVAKPTSDPISFDSDWGDDELEPIESKDVPKQIPLTAAPLPSASPIPTTTQNSAPLTAANPSTLETSLKSSTDAPNLDGDASGWSASDWGESDEEGDDAAAPTSSKHLATKSEAKSGETIEEPAKTEQLAASPTVPVSDAPASNGFDMSWGDDDEFESPSATAAPQVVESKSKEDIRAKISALTPKPAALVAPSAPTSDTVPSTETKPIATPQGAAKRTSTVAFVPPQIKHAEPPQPSTTPNSVPSQSQPSAHHPAPGVFQPSTPAVFQPVATPPLAGPLPGTDGSSIAAVPKQPKKTAFQPPKPRASVPVASTFEPTGIVAPSTASNAPITPFTPQDPTAIASNGVPSTPSSMPASSAMPPSAGQPRHARPKAAAPKLQQVYNTPFGGATTPATTAPSSRTVRSSHPGPLTLEDMRKPRAIATFGFGGVLVMSQPRLASAFSNQPPQAGAVTLMSTGQLLANTTDVIAMKAFPGPAISKSTKELSNLLVARCKHVDQASQHATGTQSNPVRVEASRLLWHMLRLLLESKGALNGPKGCEKAMHALLADTASLASPNGIGNMIPEDPLASATIGDCSDSLVSLEKRKAIVLDIQRLVQVGKREEALNLAVKENVWDHALMLAAFISPSVHRDTVSSFVLSTLSIGSPLRMAYLQLAGKSVDLFKLGGSSGGLILPGALVGASAANPLMPTGGITAGLSPMASSTQSNPYHGLIDHWKTNIATAVANKPPTPAAPPASQNAQQQAQVWNDPALMQLGDALWQHCGSVEAAHLCYLLADLGLDSALRPGSRFVLVGGDHKRYPRTVNSNVEAIHRTELLEFAKRQSNNKFCFPRFQPYKLLHAIALADMGLLKLSLEYLESIKHIVGTNVKVASQTYPPQFLTRLDEWYARIKDATSGKPISNAVSAFSGQSSTSGAASTAAGWFGNILKAAVDKVIGDEEEERREMQGSQGIKSSLGVPASGNPANTSSTDSAPPFGMHPPGTTNGPPGPLGAPYKGPGPTGFAHGMPSGTANGPPGPLSGPNGAPHGMPSGTINGPTGSIVNGSMNLPLGGQMLPPQANVKMGFPLPSIGHAHAKSGFNAPPMSHPKGQALPQLSNQIAPSGPSTTPSSANTSTTSTAPLPAIPLPSIRGAPPKAGLKGIPKPTTAKAAAAVSASTPEPVADISKPTEPKEPKETKDDGMDSDEAELFGDWDVPSKTPESDLPTKTDSQPSLKKSEPSVPASVAKTAQELEDEAELFDGSFGAPSTFTPPPTASTATPPPTSEPSVDKDLTATAAATEEKPQSHDTSDDVEETQPAKEDDATPSTAAVASPLGFLPPPKRNSAAPRKGGRTPPVAAFRPSGATPPTQAPKAAALVLKPNVEENKPASVTEPEDVDVEDEIVSPTPPLSPETPIESAATSQTSSAASLDIREATSRVKPPKPLPSADATSITAVPQVDAGEADSASEPPLPSTVTPKRPSLLPPKKTPAQKPAGLASPSSPLSSSPLGLAAPEGLPPLSAIAKQPFKPTAAPTGLPPSTQQKRAERMNKSISASALPRPDVLSPVPPNPMDDEAASDDEDDKEKVLHDAKAEIDRMDSEAIAPPTSKLPSLSGAKPKEANKRKPMPRPQPQQPSGFAPPVFMPAAPSTEPSFTPSRPDVPAVPQHNSHDDEDSGSEDDSMKTPQQKPKKSEKEKDKKDKKAEVREAPKTEPKRSRFSLFNIGSWFSKTPQKESNKSESGKPVEVKLGGNLKDSFYRHPELGWVEKGKEEEKRKELAARAAPPTKSTKKAAKPAAETTSSSDGLVTPQHGRGAFSRSGGMTGDEPSTPSVLGSSTGVPGSSRNTRGRRYVGSSGDVIDTKRNAGGASLFPVAPTTPLAAGGSFSVFTPLEAPKSEDDSTLDTSTSQDPQEPVATVKHAKKAPKESKKEKSKKPASEDAAGSEEESNDAINAQPLTYSASIPVEEESEEVAPRKSRAERLAEKAAAAQQQAPPPQPAPVTPSAAGPKKFGSPFGFGLRPKSTSSSSPRSAVTPMVPSVPTASASSNADEDEVPSPAPLEPSSASAGIAAADADPEPVAAPLPTPGLQSFKLPPAGAARAKSAVKAARPKSAASRFPPMLAPATQQ